MKDLEETLSKIDRVDSGKKAEKISKIREILEQASQETKKEFSSRFEKIMNQIRNPENKGQVTHIKNKLTNQGVLTSENYFQQEFIAYSIATGQDPKKTLSDYMKDSGTNRKIHRR